MAMPFVASAQTSSINAYSPYSMYGPGELMTPGTVQMRSLGGVGLGVRAIGQLNPQNPAAASIAPRKSFLFDVGLDATHFRNNQPKFNAEGEMMSKAKTAYNSANYGGYYFSCHLLPPLSFYVFPKTLLPSQSVALDCMKHD